MKDIGKSFNAKRWGCRGIAPCTRQIFLHVFTNRRFAAEQDLSVVIPDLLFVIPDLLFVIPDLLFVIPAEAGIQSLLIRHSGGSRNPGILP